MKQKNLVLMVVAVGCGLVAAFLTSQMSAKPQVEMTSVIVAAKDLTVGSQLTKEEMKTAVKMKQVPKDGLSPQVVLSEEELLDKRLTRTVRADETFNKADLTKNGVVSIPPGMNMVSLPIGVGSAVAGFVGPGSRVDILASFRLQSKITAMPVLVNMLVLAVDTSTAYPQNGAAFANLSMVSFAVDRKQALLIKLAQARGCDLSLLLRNPDDKVNDNDKIYDIDKVIKQLQDEKNGAKLVNEDPDTVPKAGSPDQPMEGPGLTESPTRPALPGKTATVTVPYALVEIAPGTEITNDLIADKGKFGTRELPKDLAEDAATDLSPFVGKVFKNGLGKGQWVTKNLVGAAEPKAAPREELSQPKPEPDSGRPATTVRQTHDVAVHTTSGTKYFRYEEIKPGEWRMLGEVRPGQRPPEPRPADTAGPDKKVD
ncbi:MAG: cpaB [Gemmataceae bacterium]|nr:cpaB [Gemmataceae bacterium]